MKVIDTSVYTSGLRMLGSHKGSMDKTQSEMKKHMLFFNGELPYINYYQIGTIKSNGLIEYESIDLNSLIATSILAPNENVVSEMETGMVPDAPENENLNVNTNENLNVNDNVINNNVVDPTSAHVTEIEPSLKTQLIEYLQKVDIKSIDLSELKMKRYIDSGLIEIALKCQCCPFAQRLHKRTLERNTPAVYLKISAYEQSINCWKCSEDTLSLPALPSVLKQLLKNDSPNYILKHSLYHATNETISEFCFITVKDIYSVSPISNETYKWYYYESKVHRWIQYERVIDAIMNENGIIQQEYTRYIDSITDTENQQKTIEIYEKLQAKLQTTQFVRTGILPLLARKLDYYWSSETNGVHTRFQDKLDTNPKLLGFLNGVWDFEQNIFRPGKPSDFLSMSTNNEYHPFSEFPKPMCDSLFGFLNQIFLKENHREFVLQEISSCLDSTPNKNRFFIMTGGGANGKSTLIRLLNLAMGDYAGEVSITLFTHPRPPANCPTPELMQVRGKRVVCCSEPNAKDNLNLGTIKWLTGGDRITARNLFENNVSFYLQATFFCLTNDIPPINATQQDYGTWRRLKPITFNSRFVDNPTKENEFQPDPAINDKLNYWKTAFISLLIDRYLQDTCISMPVEFEVLLQQLCNKNDVYGRYIAEYITRDPDTFMDKKIVFNSFNKWLETMRIRKTIPYDIFEKHMILLLGPLESKSNSTVTGWYIHIKAIEVHGYIF
ncbi:hypothetical protein HDU81_004323 [Chytriomyces hyalinus]|nr:hypothetical protein HDU81_004323 [Chytriomyces hyalinus]